MIKKASIAFFFMFFIMLIVIISGSSGSSVINEGTMLFGSEKAGESLYDREYYPAIIDIYKEKKVLVPLSWMWAIGLNLSPEESVSENIKEWAKLTAYKPEYYRVVVDVDEQGNEYSWEELIPSDELGCGSEEECDTKGYIKKNVLVSKEEFAEKAKKEIFHGSFPEYFFSTAISFEEADTVLFGEYDLNDPGNKEDLEEIWDQEILIPFENYVVTCEFGGYPGHNAIDLQPTPRKIATNHPMQAGCSGTISQNAYDSMGGNFVTIQCEASNLQLYYGHMISKSTYAKGSNITKGSTIGYVGSTGYVTGPHVHWKFMINGKAVNPRLLFSFK